MGLIGIQAVSNVTRLRGLWFGHFTGATRGGLAAPFNPLNQKEPE